MKNHNRLIATDLIRQKKYPKANVGQLKNSDGVNAVGT